MKPSCIILLLALFVGISMPLTSTSAMATEASTVEGTIVIPDPADSDKTITGQMFFPNPMDMMGQGMESVMGPIMDRMLEAMQKILDTILALSDDIGKMADRIGDFGDKILVMADKIVAMSDKMGGMSDNVVGTMNTMSATIETLANSQAPVANTTTVLLTSPAMNAEISRIVAPVITMSGDSSRYLLYVSTTQTFSGGQTMSILVNDTNSLDDAWLQAVDVAEGDSLYLAVKGIDEEDKVSVLSNSVKVVLVD